MSVSESDIRLEPVDVFYGNRQKSTIQTVADVSSSLGGTYWTFSSEDLDGNTTDYYVWYDVDNLSVDPAPAGKTAIEVDISANDTAAAVASATQTALASVAGFSSKASGDLVTWENGAPGGSSGAPADFDAGFTFSNLVTGSRVDLGGTDGAVEFSPEVSMVEVKADQLGETLLDSIQNGNNLSVSMSLLEVTAAKWKTLIGDVSGDTLVVGADEIHGFGESKRFSNMKQFSKELVLRPSNATNNDRNIHVWSAFPNPSSVSFSGTDLQTMEVEFSAYRDSNRPQEISLFGFGPQSKGVLA